jgi:hypothetical protein
MFDQGSSYSHGKGVTNLLVSNCFERHLRSRPPFPFASQGQPQRLETSSHEAPSSAYIRHQSVWLHGDVSEPFLDIYIQFSNQRSQGSSENHKGCCNGLKLSLYGPWPPSLLLLLTLCCVRFPGAVDLFYFRFDHFLISFSFLLEP